MALAVTATTDAVTASVQLSITGAAAGAVSITRADAHGTEVVRQRSGAVTIAGALTVNDYEPALDELVVYTVTDSSSASASTSVTMPAVSGAWLHNVQLPQSFARPGLVLSYDAQRRPATSIHDVIGRDDPVPVLGRAGRRRGSLSLWFATHAAAEDAAAVLAAASVFQLRNARDTALDLWFVLGSAGTGVKPLALAAAGWRWELSVDYVEVRSPSLPLLGDAGWTYDDLLATFPTYNAVRATFPTYNALLVGP